MTDSLAAMAAFAEARLAEDEVAARAYVPVAGHTHRHAEGNGWREHNHMAGGLPHQHDPDSGFQVPAPTVGDPDRILAEIESTRMLLAEIQAMPHDYVDGDVWCPAGHEPPSGPCRCGSDDRKQRMLAAIAMRWNDHRDYLPGWAPEAVGG